MTKCPFSSGEHSRPSTCLQLRLNHFCTSARSVSRAGLTAGASGSTTLPAGVRPVRRGSPLWQLAQETLWPT